MNYYEFQWLVSYWIILIRPKFYKGLTTKLITSFSHESPRVTYLNQSVHDIFTFLVDCGLLASRTLVTRLVQEFIQLGTVILSDKFSPYFNLNDIGYTHLMVNHCENFVDPYTGAHTNTIEGVWNAVKKKLKRMCGTFKHQLPSYLDEFNWQRVYPGERFQMMLQHIAELYPVH